MKLGIICAMHEEIELILENLKVLNVVNLATLSFNVSKIGDKDIISVISGIGKVNAAICSQILISEFKCDLIINVGCAGGLGNNVKHMDIVIASDLVQYDMNVNNNPGQIPRLDTFSFKSDEKINNLIKESCDEVFSNKDNSYHIGRIVSGDKFISSKEESEYLKNYFNAVACEMEGASIAHVCYLNNIPFSIIRAISDNANDDAEKDFDIFLKLTSKITTDILMRTINKL